MKQSMNNETKTTGTGELSKALGTLSAAVSLSRTELQRALERLEKVEKHLTHFSESLAKPRPTPG